MVIDGMVVLTKEDGVHGLLIAWEIGTGYDFTPVRASNSRILALPMKNIEMIHYIGHPIGCQSHWCKIGRFQGSQPGAADSQFRVNSSCQYLSIPCCLSIERLS